MTAPRFRLARERAGLSLGQAARLLGLTRAELEVIERAAAVESDVDLRAMCDVYAVRPEWLTGQVEQHDYAPIDRMKGADTLTAHDRDTLAEFAASMPRGGGSFAERIKAKGST